MFSLVALVIASPVPTAERLDGMSNLTVLQSHRPKALFRTLPDEPYSP